jgi:hypothetical protein
MQIPDLHLAIHNIGIAWQHQQFYAFVTMSGCQLLKRSNEHSAGALSWRLNQDRANALFALIVITMISHLVLAVANRELG